jgi:hypothetical protein
MFDTIVTNVLLPGAFVALFVVLPLWWGLRDGPRDHRRPDDQPSDLSPLWIRSAAVLSVFGPFWYQPYSRPRIPVSEPSHPKEGDSA